MNPFELVHHHYVHERRARILCREFAGMLPPDARVLDIGCGDGLLSGMVMAARKDVRIEGIDVLVRPNPRIPVRAFDGHRIPAADGSYDLALFADVLHHTEDPMILLREAARVSRAGILLKDHLCRSPADYRVLRFMDRVSNRRHGVSLPHNYWSLERWIRAAEELGLDFGAWESDFHQYPFPMDFVFGGSKQFVARLDRPAARPPRPAPSPRAEEETREWEAAYRRFETPDQEIAKFISRLLAAGASDWPRHSRIAELFCGRGNGLHALHRLGFTDIEGLDRSAELVADYRGPGRCLVADCLALPLPADSKDIVIVQGGLHHLLFPADLQGALREARRVLRPGGIFLAVEPWLTPFLRAAHLACGSSLARGLSPKVDALAAMIQLERSTYEEWLRQPLLIQGLFRHFFREEHCRLAAGKIMFVGRKAEK